MRKRPPGLDERLLGHIIGVGRVSEDRLRQAERGSETGRDERVVGMDVTVPSTFIATVEAIAATGARPVLVDIDPATRCMDPERVAAAVTAETAAVVIPKAIFDGPDGRYDHGRHG